MNEHHDVAVIGGGQAGLAVGHHLARQGRGFTILEAADEPAAAWRTRWDSLRLFTPVRHDSLPGLAFPGDPDHYPARDEVVDYLTGYARHFDLPVRLGSRVTRLRAEDGGYRVELADGSITAGQVVVATGPFQTPRVPRLSRDLDPSVTQLHSSEYRRPGQVPDGRVLVVGGGNTGYQIAEELSVTHQVHLAIGSRQTPLPQRLLGRDVFTYFTRLGLMDKTADTRMGRRMRDRETLIGSSPRSARRSGIRLHGRAESADGDRVAFAGGTSAQVTTVIWATGFGVDHSWIDAPVFDAAGGLVHRRGVTASPGLCFLGMPWQHTRGSALLGWVKDDAEHIAAQLQRDRASMSA